MALIRTITAAFLFIILVYFRCLWYPIIDFLVMIVTTICISWHMGCWLCKRIILRQILPRVCPNGKAVLITGCDSGFGHKLALELNRIGFYVFAACLKDKSGGAKDLTKKCSKPNRITILQMDVTKVDDVNRAFHDVSNFLSSNNEAGVHQLFALINNAGILTCGEIEWWNSNASGAGAGDGHDDCANDYQRMLDVNLIGLIRVTRIFLPLIRSPSSTSKSNDNNGGARIINVTSSMARTNVHSVNAYCVSKTAASKFTDGLQQEISSLGVTCINVEPWFFATPILTPDYVRESMRNSWISSKAEVRDTYGTERYIESTDKLIFMCTSEKNVYPDPSIVVDQIVDAVTSAEPSLNYRIIGMDKGILYWIVNDFLPFDLIPIARRILYAFIPTTSGK